MKYTIWKYPLQIEDIQEVEMPADAQVLCVEVQNGQPCLWAKIEITKLDAVYKIATVRTGYSADHAEGMRYIGTYLLHGDKFVGHVFCD